MRSRSLLVGLALVSLVACGGEAGSPQPTRGEGQTQQGDFGPTKSTTVSIDEIDGSGVSGIARLETVGPEDAQIDVELEGAPRGPLALHVHSGGCGTESAEPSHVVEPAVDGKSSSTVGASVQGLTRGGFSLSVHANEDPRSDHIACGNIGTGPVDE